MTVYRGFAVDESVVHRSKLRRVGEWSAATIDQAVANVTTDFLQGRVRNPLQAQFREHPGTYRNVFRPTDPVDAAAKNPTLVEFVGPSEGQDLAPTLAIYRVVEFVA